MPEKSNQKDPTVIIGAGPAGLTAAHALSGEGRPRRVSLLHYAPLLVALMVILADSGQRTDADLWGHVRFGQAALLHHGPLVTDPYSYSAWGQPWRNHEWLTEMVMALSYDNLGVLGLKLWKFGCTAATILFVVLAMAETGASPGVQLGTLTVTSLALVMQMQFRPQLFTFMFFAAMLAILARHNYRGSARLWLVIPMMMLWGNLHGGYIIGIATLATYTAVAGAQDWFAGRGLNRALKLAMLTGAGTAATLFSPYGIDNWLVVFTALRDNAPRSVLNDWQPLIHSLAAQWQANHLGVVYYFCVLAMIAAFAASFLLHPAGDDLPLAVIAAMMSAAAFAAVRNMPLAAIACAVPAARHLELVCANLRERAAANGVHLEPPPERSDVNPWLAGAGAVALALYLGLFSAHIATDMDYPSGAIAYMKAHHLQGNVLVNFNWAQYFIWQEPESKVFIDGRNDTVYGPAIRDQYLNFYFARGDARAVLERYRHDFVLVPPKSKADGIIVKTAGWKLLYQDGDAALFGRSDLAAAPSGGAVVTRGRFTRAVLSLIDVPAGATSAPPRRSRDCSFAPRRRARHSGRPGARIPRRRPVRAWATIGPIRARWRPSPCAAPA